MDYVLGVGWFSERKEGVVGEESVSGLESNCMYIAVLFYVFLIFQYAKFMTVLPNKPVKERLSTSRTNLLPGEGQ